MMKSNILKAIATVGVVSLFTMAGSASASGYHHYCDCDHYSYEHYDHDDYGLQMHTYHAAEYPFIW